MGACFWFSAASFPIPSKPTPLENQKHTHGGVFLVFAGFPRLHLPAACPLPPTSPSTGMPDTPTCLPSPLLPAKHGKRAHVALFLCLALLHLSPPAEHEKRANTSMLVCSLCSVLPVHPPFTPDTENTPMWVCSLVFSPPSSSLLVTALLGKFLFR